MIEDDSVMDALLAQNLRLVEAERQLREAAAHIGELLAGVQSTGGGMGEQGPYNYEQTKRRARAFLKSYIDSQVGKEKP